MNIIFGDSVESIPDHYIVLELDTFRRPGETETVTAYCLVEKLALDEFATMESYKKIHADVIKNYKLRHWEYCEHAIQGLMGKWGGELDTFYTDLLDRVISYKQQEPTKDWDGVRVRIG